MTRSTADVLATALAEHGDVHDALVESWAAAWEAADPVLLELCRLRIAMLLGSADELAVRTPAAVAAGLDEAVVTELRHWPTSPHYGPTERACLAFTEAYIIDVAGLDDATAGAVREALGEQAFLDFVNALLVVEQRQRLRLTWERLGAV